MSTVKQMTNTLKKSVRPLTNLAPTSIKTLTNKMTNKSVKIITEICLPAKVYLVLGVVLIIGKLAMSGYPGFGILFFSILSSAIGVWLMNVLCNKGWLKIAWTITILSTIGTLSQLVFFSGSLIKE
jgi:hypothetical protein